MKMIEVVAAIIERDGKILLAQRPAQSDQAGLWEVPVVKSSRMKVSGRRWCVSYAKNWASKQLWVNMLPAISEKFGRIIHLHAWHVPDFHGTLQAHEHQALVWCSPEEALQYPLAPADIPLLEAFMALRAARPAD
ncbi:pyrimidine (deoxy)nucleoside triphosphate diphosphatase [Escherichia coli]